jgi:hypothetical protein
VRVCGGLAAQCQWNVEVFVACCSVARGDRPEILKQLASGRAAKQWVRKSRERCVERVWELTKEHRIKRSSPGADGKEEVGWRKRKRVVWQEKRGSVAGRGR